MAIGFEPIFALHPLSESLCDSQSHLIFRCHTSNADGQGPKGSVGVMYTYFATDQIHKKEKYMTD